MALSKEERRAIEGLRELLSTEHMAKCGFRLSPNSFNNDAPAIAEATRIWRESWVLPLINALLGEHEKDGYHSRSEALGHGL